ncbi:HAD-IIA family hydrolase [uncultured Micrococcus sp.]|uniref:HAD-IIA family hydrolase n=1 Tax=uncultured Micrococcus sp. TaxID=114051 RepID=UPI00130E3390|nr:HAD-IIA family hydrolase [uncultured Micrococcus sp.]
MRLPDIDGVLCDLDGVVYSGAEAVPGAVEGLGRLRAHGVPVAFVTNNASRPPQAVTEHLRALGVRAEAEDVFGSAPAAVDLLDEAVRPGDAVLVVGSGYLRDLVAAAGYRPVNTADERPAAVIQGFDPDTGWRHLAEASYAIARGAVWVATNLDRSIPRAEGTAPGNGSLVAAVTAATGAVPRAAGKPEPLLFRTAAEACGMHRPLVVGDRLDTDVRGGNAAGFTTALVLTGVDDRARARAADDADRPDHVVPDLTALAEALSRA